MHGFAASIRPNYDGVRYRGSPARFKGSAPALWLRADRGVTVATGISSWADQFGGTAWTQGTGSLQPALATGANGRPVARGDGVDDFLSATGITLGAATTVLMIASASSVATVYLLADSSGGNLGIISAFGGVAFELFNGADRKTFAGSASGMHLLAFTQTDASAAAMYYDVLSPAVQSYVPTVAMAARVLNRLLDKPAPEGAWAASDAGELIIFTSVLSLGVLARLFPYLKAIHKV